MDILAALKNTVQKQGQNPVQFFNNDILTYQELWDKSERLARHFLSLNTDNRPIIVLGNKTKDMIISFVAATKSGRPYIPVDIIMPNERIRHMISAAKPLALINTLPDHDITFLKKEELQFIDIKELQEIYSGPLPEICPRERQVRQDQVYYILFTSGSTGMPKGVQILRSNLEDFLDWTVPTYGYGKEPQLFLNQAPFTFDVSHYELYNALVTGGAIVSIGNEHIQDFKKLFEALYKHSLNLNVWISTPSFLVLCLKDPNFTGNSFPKLRQFAIMGEAFPKNLAKELLEKFPRTSLYNMYGPTEGTIVTTEYKITQETLTKYPSIPIGRSKPRSQILIDNGEIVISGPNISPGYLNDPVRTDKVFFKLDGEGAYRTGDRGFINEEGLVFCQGRIDFQIKLNGYRIELEEIEKILNRIEFIKNSCVIPKFEDNRVLWICGFLVLNDKEKGKNMLGLRKELKSYLTQHLPFYMVPKQFICLESMPFTPNGKVDRNLLRTMI